MEAGYGHHMADAADLQVRIHFIGKVRSIAKQDRLGEGGHILRKGLYQDIHGRLRYPGRKIADPILRQAQESQFISLVRS